MTLALLIYVIGMALDLTSTHLGLARGLTERAPVYRSLAPGLVVPVAALVAIIGALTLAWAYAATGWLAIPLVLVGIGIWRGAIGITNFSRIRAHKETTRE